MGAYDRVKDWVAREKLTAADINAEFDNVIAMVEGGPVVEGGLVGPRINVLGGTGGIAAGSLVWLSGATGTGDLQVATPAVSSDVAGSTLYAMAYAPDAILEDAEGEVSMCYEATDLDTSTAVAGQLVYLSVIDGEYSLDLPSPGYRVQVVGYVSQVSATVGRIQFTLPGSIIPWSIADQIL